MPYLRTWFCDSTRCRSWPPLPYLQGSMQLLLLVGTLCIVLCCAQAGHGQGYAQAKETARVWIHALLAKGANDVSVASSHPELKLHVYEDNDPSSPHHGLKICWMLLPRPSIRMKVSDIRKSGPSNVIYAALAQPSDVVVMDGGFFGYGPNNSYVPVGLVITDGKVQSQRGRWSGGGAVVQGRALLTVVPMSALPSLDHLQHAIQSKPMLVEGGKMGIKSDSKPPFNRVAVGVNQDGNIIVAGAFQDDGTAVTLVEFSAFLSAKQSEGGPQAVYALNLDGGPDAHLYFPGIGLHMGYGGQNFVPNAIHFNWK